MPLTFLPFLPAPLSVSVGIIARVTGLLSSPGELARLRANARRLHRPATAIIVREILGAL
jgi:hypothetical protein